MNPRSKSVWIPPAAFAAVVPRLSVQGLMDEPIESGTVESERPEKLGAILFRKLNQLHLQVCTEYDHLGILFLGVLLDTPYVHTAVG